MKDLRKLFHIPAPRQHGSVGKLFNGDPFADVLVHIVNGESQTAQKGSIFVVGGVIELFVQQVGKF